MTPLALCEPRRVTTLISHSSEQGTLPTASLISKQVVPYQKCGSPCCPGVSTPDSVLSRFEHDKPHHLTDSNHLHHSKPCLNHSTEPHHGHLTSQWMEDQHSQHSTQVKLNIIKMERLVRRLKSAWLNITTNHKRPILKYEGLGNQLMHALVYTRERKHIGTKWSRVTCLASRLLRLRVFPS
jgi:hypothetical protein